MTINSIDDAIAGMKMPIPFYKTGITMSSAGAMRAYTPWYQGGVPGASAAPTVGVNGEAVVPSLSSPAGVVGGMIPRTNPIGGEDAYLARLALIASQPGTLWLVDRIWHNSGLSVTSTSAQAITPATAAARDRNASANGDGIFAGLEWSATGGVGTPTVNITYTNSDGTGGRTATLGAVGQPPIGMVELFQLQAGDKGVRDITSFIQNSTRTSGAMHLVLFRQIAALDITAANAGNAIDILTGGRPEILDDSVLQLLWFPSLTAGVNLIGSYIETQG